MLEHGPLLVGLMITSPALATDVIILKSSDIAAYNPAINGFKAAIPAGINLSEYDLQETFGEGPETGRKSAHPIRHWSSPSD